HHRKATGAEIPRLTIFSLGYVVDRPLSMPFFPNHATHNSNSDDITCGFLYQKPPDGQTDHPPATFLRQLLYTHSHVSALHYLLNQTIDVHFMIYFFYWLAHFQH